MSAPEEMPDKLLIKLVDNPRSVCYGMYINAAGGKEYVRADLAPQWQDIATAPKDGTPVLIWKGDERRVGEYTMSAYWDEDESGFVPVGGNNKQGYFSDWEKKDQGYPTHWMPMPTPPDPAP